MQTAGAALLLLMAFSTGASAQADPYHWCALYTGNGLGGASNCYFVTRQQCLDTVSGVGGQCIPNPFNPPAGTPSRPVPRAR